MKRRTFLKIVSSAGVASLLSPAFAAQVCKSKVGNPFLSLEEEFRNPSFRVWGIYMVALDEWKYYQRRHNP